MMIRHNNHGTELHNGNITVTTNGHVRLVYENNGLTVVVDSVPRMFFNDVSIKNIDSDIVIELEPTF